MYLVIRSELFVFLNFVEFIMRFLVYDSSNIGYTVVSHVSILIEDATTIRIATS